MVNFQSLSFIVPLIKSLGLIILAVISTFYGKIAILLIKYVIILYGTLWKCQNVLHSVQLGPLPDKQNVISTATVAYSILV